MILAFFVGAFLLTMALAGAAHDREEFLRVDANHRLGRSFFESMRDHRLGVPLSTGDTSKWN